MTKFALDLAAFLFVAAVSLGVFALGAETYFAFFSLN